MARMMDESTCRNCTNKNAARLPPCMRAHKMSGQTPALLMVDSDEAGDPCPFSCSWDDLWMFLSGKKPFVADSKTKAGLEVLRKRFTDLQNRGVEFQKRAGHVDDFAANSIGFLKKGYRRVFMTGSTGIFLVGNPFYGPEKVFIRVYPRQHNTDWQEFWNWYRDFVKADIAGCTDAELWCWVLDEAARQAPQQFGAMLGEMKNNIANVILIFAAFAAMQAFALGRALSVILGLASTGQDVIDIATKFIACAQSFKKAKQTRQSKYLREAGTNLAQGLSKALLVGGIAAAGFVVGKLLHWFVKKSPKDWKDASQPPKTPAATGPARAPASLRPHPAIAVADVRQTFRAEIDGLESGFFKPLEELGNPSAWGVKPGYKSMEAHLPTEDFRKLAASYRGFFRESLGHSQVVEAGGQVFDAYLAAMRRRGPITPALVKEYFPALEGKEADVAAGILSKIQGRLAETTRRHDVQGVGGKLNVPVGKGMRLPDKSALREFQEMRQAYLRDHPNASPSEVSSHIRQQLSQDPQKMQAFLNGIKVDRARLLHNQNFAHHKPSTPEDWVEMGIDIVAALCQKRCYRPSDPGKSPMSLKIGKSEGGRAESTVESAMLKIGRQIMQDVEDAKGQDFIRDPQAALSNIF